MRSTRRTLAAAALAALALTSASPVAASAATDGSAPTCAGPAPVKANGTKWRCTFDDEFDGSELDPSNWQPVTSAQTGTGGQTAACFVDSPNNVSVGNGTLSLTARRESAPITCGHGASAFSTEVTLGQVASPGRFSQTYGRFSVRAKFPSSVVRGLQSSLWMWPSDPYSSSLVGEIDIAEEYSVAADRAIPYLHYKYDKSTVNPRTNTNVYTNNYCMISDVNAFHDYTVEWTPTTMTIVYDGKTCLTNNLLTLGASPFDQPYFLALSQGLGGGGNAFDPATTQLPATTQVDWVRVWK